MREILLEEAKKIELDILIDIANFCDTHGLRYYLAYGTLIGAIRHKGFIPWDDDIDITMPRADYNEFLRTYNAEGKIYRVIDPRTNIACHTFAKVIDTRTVKIEPMVNYKETLGIDVDIFPLDGMPESDKEYNRWYNQLYRLYKKHTYSVMTPNSKSWWQNFKLRIRRFGVPQREKLLKKTEALHKPYPYENSTYVGAIECQWSWRKDRTKKDAYESTVDVEFEGLRFKAPIGYDTVLRNIYGDYMQLPPEEKRVTHHTNNTYWKE